MGFDEGEDELHVGLGDLDAATGWFAGVERVNQVFDECEGRTVAFDLGKGLLEESRAAGGIVHGRVFVEFPGLAVVAGGDGALLADGFVITGSAGEQCVALDAVAELNDALGDRVGLEGVAVEEVFVFAAQVGLHPVDRFVVVHAQHEIEGVARCVKERAVVVDDDGLQRADFAAVDDLFHPVVPVIPASVRAHIEDDAFPLDCGGHVVGFLERGAERLFRVDGFDAVVRGEDDDLRAVLRLRGHADDVRPFLFDEFLVVGVMFLFRDAVGLAEFFHHVLTEIGTRDNLRARAGRVTGRVRVRQVDGCVTDNFVINKRPHAGAANECGAEGRHGNT